MTRRLIVIKIITIKHYTMEKTVFIFLKGISMSSEKINIALPIRIDNIIVGDLTITKAICPYFNTEYSLDGLADLTQLDNNSNDLTIQNRFTLLQLTSQLHQQLQQYYDLEGFLDQPTDISNHLRDRIDQNSYWISLNFELIAKPKKICEIMLPKIATGSAIISQALLLMSASISIYVKGVSAPLTLIIVTATAISTLINFTQSGTSESMARIGAYLDHKSLKKCCRGCAEIKPKSLWVSSGIVLGAIWGTTLVGNSISAFSETEIIDNAGHAAGLTFLSPGVVLIHAIALTVFGGITSGLFGGNFAYRALNNFCEWVIRRCNESEPNIDYEGENSPFRQNPY